MTAARRTSALEWIVAALGLLLVLGTLGFLVADARGGGPRAARLTVRVDSVVPMAGGAAVHFTARNAGRETAAAVQVRGERRGGAEAEESAATLDYVPGRSSRRGTLHFTGPADAGAVRLRVEGFEEP